MARTISFTILVGLLCSLVVLGAKGELKIGMKAPDFALKDAEDKDYRLSKLRGNVIVLIMGNSKIRKEDDKWAAAIQKDFKEIREIKFRFYLTFVLDDMRMMVKRPNNKKEVFQILQRVSKVDVGLFKGV